MDLGGVCSCFDPFLKAISGREGAVGLLLVPRFWTQVGEIRDEAGKIYRLSGKEEACF